MKQVILLDERIAENLSTYTVAHPTLSALAVFLGVGLVYTLPVILVIIWFTNQRKLALKAALTGLLAWEGLSKLVAALVHRERPAFSQIGVKELVFHRPDTSFPSDHSAFLAAIALTFYLAGQKGLGNLVIAIALVVGLTRVMIGVHFPGDILAGWIVGVVTALLIRLIDQPVDQYILEPLVRLARKFKL